MKRPDKDFKNYILEYCEGCELDESFYCRLACPVYKSYIYISTREWESPCGIDESNDAVQNPLEQKEKK